MMKIVKGVFVTYFLLISAFSEAQDILKSYQHGFVQSNILLIPRYANFNFDIEILAQSKARSNVISTGALYINSEIFERKNWFLGYQHRFYLQQIESKGVSFFVAPYSKIVFRNVNDSGDKGIVSIFPSQKFKSRSLVIGGNLGPKFYWKRVSVEGCTGLGLGKIISYKTDIEGFIPSNLFIDINFQLNLGVRF